MIVAMGDVPVERPNYLLMLMRSQQPRGLDLASLHRSTVWASWGLLQAVAGANLWGVFRLGLGLNSEIK